MTSIQHGTVPAPARTDLDATGPLPVPTQRRGQGRHAAPNPAGPPGAPAPAPAPMPTVTPTATVSTTAVRATGAALTVFSAGWAVSMLLQTEASASSLVGAASAVAFQCSLLALLALVWRTRATGPRTAGRVLVGIEAGVLGLATIQSISEVVPGAEVVRTVLDLTWPLSMLGMLIVGITVAVAGVWRGAARAWTPVACSWIALLPSMAVLPMSAVGYVMTGHILVGYCVLGAILAVAPGLARR